MTDNGSNAQKARPRRRYILDNAFDNYPLLRYVVPLAVGIVCGYAGNNLFCGYERTFLLCAVCATAFLVFFAFFRRLDEGDMRFTLAVNAFFFFFGAYSVLRAVSSMKHEWKDTPVVGIGVIADRPILYDKVMRMRVILAGEYSEGMLHPLKRTVELAVVRSSETDTLQTGDGVKFYAQITTPHNTGNPYEPDYASNLLRAGVSGTAFAFKGKVKPLDISTTRRMMDANLDSGEKISLRAKKLRDRLQHVYEQSGISGESLAVLSALTLGDKHLLTRSTRELFSETGVSHILALSGLHLGILYGILQLIFTAGGFVRRMRLPAQAVIIIFIWLYTVMAGMPSSLIRAAIMYSLVSLAVMIRRKAVTLNNLFAAAFIMLLFNPMSLFDIGFRLSFLSVLFILVFTRRLIPRALLRHRFAGKIWGMVSVSVCAQVGVAPLVAYYFHSFPVYFIPSNLIVVPMAFFLVSGGLVLLLFSWLPPVATITAATLKFLLSFMLDVLERIDDLPAASLDVFPSQWTVAFVYAASFFGVMYLRKRSIPLLTLCMLCVFAATTSETIDNAREKHLAGVYFYNGLYVPAVHFVASQDESYIYVPTHTEDSVAIRSLAGVERTFWRRCGMNAPIRLPQSFRSRIMLRNGCLMQLGNRRICILDTAFPRKAVPQEIRTDALYVVRGFKGDIEPWLKRLRPPFVILDAGLSDYRRDHVLRKCAALGTNVHDMRTHGAFVLR